MNNMASAEIPWGWWLRVNGSVVEDGKGGAWDSVRAAFWTGQLGFPASAKFQEQIELLLRVLTALHLRPDEHTESLYDLFTGDHMFWRFYICWLASVGLVAPHDDRLGLTPELSPEGRSVLLMLQATRDSLWCEVPMSEVTAAVLTAKGERLGALEATLKAFEVEVAGRPHVFARERLHKQPVITLTASCRGARMPLRRVVWSMSFPHAGERDAFFLWLSRRLDRWDAWGELAYHDGAEALTRRILQLKIGVDAKEVGGSE